MFISLVPTKNSIQITENPDLFLSPDITESGYVLEDIATGIDRTYFLEKGLAKNHIEELVNHIKQNTEPEKQQDRRHVYQMKQQIKHRSTKLFKSKIPLTFHTLW